MRNLDHAKVCKSQDDLQKLPDKLRQALWQQHKRALDLADPETTNRWNKVQELKKGKNQLKNKVRALVLELGGDLMICG